MENKNMFTPIDFVITWVDGNDPQWLKSKTANSSDDSVYCDNRDVRFRDWDILMYWFRTVELYAPWVRKIHFVTCGQIPQWLNTANPKLVMVSHSDFMPQECLPTFNSAAIEVNLHKIKGLAERFVYFNDDMFVAAPVKPKDFFDKEMPVDKGVENVIPLVNDPNFRIINSIMRNGTLVINKHFKKREFLKQNFTKWYSPFLGREVLRNILLSPWKEFCGFYTYHIPTSFLKSTFIEVENTESELLREVSMHKFRTDEDVVQWLFQNWQIAKGEYVIPHHRSTKVICLRKENLLSIEKTICKKKYKLICLNDVDADEKEYLEMKEELRSIFENAFPKKSSFEL